MSSRRTRAKRHQKLINRILYGEKSTPTKPIPKKPTSKGK